jgi:hypothetical protein
LLTTTAWAAENAEADYHMKVVMLDTAGFDHCTSFQEGIHNYEAKAVAEAWLKEGTFWDSAETIIPREYNYAEGEKTGKAFSHTTSKFGIMATKRPSFPWFKVGLRLAKITLDPIGFDIEDSVELGLMYEHEGDSYDLWSAKVELVWDEINLDFDLVVTDPSGNLDESDFEKLIEEEPGFGDATVWQLKEEIDLEFLVDISTLPEDAEMNAMMLVTHHAEVAGVPEPATLGLLAVGGLALLRCRKRK